MGEYHSTNPPLDTRLTLHLPLILLLQYRRPGWEEGQDFESIKIINAPDIIVERFNNNVVKELDQKILNQAL